MPPSADAEKRPVLIAYDGSDHSKGAIAEAGRELASGRRAVVLTVREPFEKIAFAGLGGEIVLDPATLSAMQESAENEALAAAEDGTGSPPTPGSRPRPGSRSPRAPGRESSRSATRSTPA